MRRLALATRRSKFQTMPRRLFAAFVLGLAISPWSALAMDAEALYYDQDYQASYEAYDARLGEGGKHRSELEYSAGTAAFKTENYGQAAEHLGRAILADDETLRSKAYYNLGNTLFRLGQESEEQEEIEAQWQSAIDHYADAEALGGVMERSARHNREVVEKHLAALKGEETPESDDQQQDQNQDGEEGEEGEDKEQQKQDGQQNQDSQDQNSGEEGQDQETQDQSQEGQDQQQPQDGQEQEGQEGEQQQDQQSQEGKEGEQEQGQQGKPGDEGKEDEQPSQSSQEGQEGEEGNPAEETKELDGEVKAADDKGQNPDGDPKAKEGPQKPSAYELTPDGKLSEAAARALLESLEGEEVKAPFEVRRSKQRRRVIRDW